MQVFRRIDSMADIKNAAFVVGDSATDPVVNSVISVLGQENSILDFRNDPVRQLLESQPDIIFVGSSDHNGGTERFSLCHSLREAGWQGIVVLIAGTKDNGNTATITSEGFDNYILSTDGIERIKDAIYWAILNRKRRNKHAIQFDGSPDRIYTVDRTGNIYDVNIKGTDGSELKPKDVVKRGVRITELGTLDVFASLIQPLIIQENVGKIFNHIVDEVDEVTQVKVRIHNVPTIGLVATVIKSDITKMMYSRTMDILVNSVTLLSHRDNYTAEHSSRVFYYCTHIAGVMGLSKAKKFMRALCFAALLHDIGKIGIKDSVLLKPGPLNRAEHEELTTHPVKGCDMLHAYKFLKDSMDLVRSHHERPDGLGYPDRLPESKIPFGASIISVADCFDAMTSNRPYRDSLPYEKAVQEVEDHLGVQFDEEVGKAFLSLITPEMVEKIRNESRKPLNVISEELIDAIVK